MTGIATTIQGTPHASRLQVTCVVPADYAELAAFLASFPDDETGSADAWLDRMRAWWDLNPAFEDSMARGWVLRYDDRIVGFFGSIPRRFRLGGRETTVFASTTWRGLCSAIAEACAIASREGIDPAVLYDLLTCSTGDSRVLRTRWGRWLEP